MSDAAIKSQVSVSGNPSHFSGGREATRGNLFPVSALSSLSDVDR
jgi:hypothetical protein